jgi:outer membrane protein assembly factor BamB
VAGQLLAISGRESVRYEAASRTLAFRGKTAWQQAVPKPAQVTALVLTNSHVVAAGSRDRQAELPEGMLWLIDKRDGAIVSAAQLPAEVTLDGLAVAQGRVFASTRDGRLLCFGP